MEAGKSDTDDPLPNRRPSAPFPVELPHTYWNPDPSPVRYLLVMTPNIFRVIQKIHSLKERTPPLSSNSSETTIPRSCWAGTALLNMLENNALQAQLQLSSPTRVS